jgi:hypothetical protein
MFRYGRRFVNCVLRQRSPLSVRNQSTPFSFSDYVQNELLMIALDIGINLRFSASSARSALLLPVHHVTKLEIRDTGTKPTKA